LHSTKSFGAMREVSVDMNIAEKILAAVSGRDGVKPGEIVEAEVDMAMVNDIHGPLTIQAFKKIGVDSGDVCSGHG
jgi:homoaconitase/3-isopropylmalate dehydratase large subunit